MGVIVVKVIQLPAVTNLRYKRSLCIKHQLSDPLNLPYFESAHLVILDDKQIDLLLGSLIYSDFNDFH